MSPQKIPLRRGIIKGSLVIFSTLKVFTFEITELHIMCFFERGKGIPHVAPKQMT